MSPAGEPSVVLRSALFNLYFFGLTFVLAVYGIGIRLFAPHRTLDLARFWIGLTLAGLRRICGITYQVHGCEYLPKSGPALIASQHQSAFDTLVWVMLVPRPAYVVKKELSQVPLFGPLLRSGGQIFVDRSAGAAAIRSLLRETDRAVADQRQIIIFPEGTRAEPGARLPIQPGVAAQASRSGLPVIPVATDSGRYWGRRAFRKRPGIIHIRIGAPIPADLPRPELLGRLEAGWEAAGESGCDHVDKSVD
jgi:1-acyl-sn-glycerol-3-phosphate acyltransferase